MCGTSRSWNVLTLPIVLALGMAALFPRGVSATSVNQVTGLPTLPAFIESVTDGEAAVLRGVYVDGLFALRVIQQPRFYTTYVSPSDDSVTQFSSADELGNIGLLAHNYLSGRYFFDLRPGQMIALIYGDGRLESYRVMGTFAYQAESPRSSSSDFIDLENNEVFAADSLFVKMYGGRKHLVFQTCITRNGNSSWGRLFVSAIPAEKPSSEPWMN